MLTGTLTLDPVTLPESCNAVYLLDDAAIPADGSVLYEASLDGGTTWEAVTSGDVTALAHSGQSLQVRATLTLADDSPNEGRVSWFIAYATTTS